jgi:hypothetical protein
MKIVYYPLVLLFFIFLFAFVNSMAMLGAMALKILNIGLAVVMIMFFVVSAMHWGDKEN